jgi:hypothetical protein
MHHNHNILIVDPGQYSIWIVFFPPYNLPVAIFFHICRGVVDHKSFVKMLPHLFRMVTPPFLGFL